MKLSDLEDADRIPTRDYISAGLADLFKVMLDQQKSMGDFCAGRNARDELRNGGSHPPSHFAE
ncbi:MAG TPA: hypothetical protein VN957_21305 [Chthoniobacterales bacterium]|nr:hypothetical protein [Chthoniobacterales bacterium]